jgi:quercetin dioxygenase-like cupin family protein
MLVRRADEMEGTPVQMEGAEAVEPGGHTPHHSHNYEHEVFVVEGAGRIEQDGDRRDLRPGDVVFVRPNVVHQFTNTGDGPFKFLCIVPVSYDCGTPTPGS